MSGHAAHAQISARFDRLSTGPSGIGFVTVLGIAFEGQSLERLALHSRREAEYGTPSYD
jgi:hypothetical protein